MNYYARINPCKHCRLSEDSIHIGKSSHGWTFTFHAVDEYDLDIVIRSWSKWMKFLMRIDVAIFNEDGEEIPKEKFVALVVSKKNEPNNHAQKYKDGSDNYSATQFLDDAGNSFSEGEFC